MEKMEVEEKQEGRVEEERGKEKMERKIKELEKKIEYKVRQKRKKNIIIKGMKGEGETRIEVEKLMESLEK